MKKMINIKRTDTLNGIPFQLPTVASSNPSNTLPRSRGSRCRNGFAQSGAAGRGGGHIWLFFSFFFW